MINEPKTATLSREISGATVVMTASTRAERPMTIAWILQRLEAVRQQVSIRWCGIPGAFAGYNELQIPRDVERATGCVTFAGHLLATGITTHTVELIACVPSGCSATPSRILARGVGCTLQVPTLRKV